MCCNDDPHFQIINLEICTLKKGNDPRKKEKKRKKDRKKKKKERKKREREIEGERST